MYGDNAIAVVDRQVLHIRSNCCYDAACFPSKTSFLMNTNLDEARGEENVFEIRPNGLRLDLCSVRWDLRESFFDGLLKVTAGGGIDVVLNFLVG
ncbi:hypothetical protein EYZ11_009601 [Aspergillus tanneri]|uniref:Uncharacterized protein n=1 Tax=Aspergillus tanneri TaxID=1220188 RepID=A0A4S3J7H4_9EURO|nr:uncharacterized protein ATNIH1004_006562 [Aspergillus tanneri]KAA8647860.1 hypothetical protein ATNIH1004_006562 [Aspergillus tanneri]THC90929.1 hypothetical protein EYZ11_009601 [Aspergillus tanneri]